LLSYYGLSKKPLLFKSLTGLAVKQFDDTLDKEIVERLSKHEIQRLSKRKNRERETGARRSFNLDLKDRFLMLLVYYRLYITFSLAVGFLFDLDKYNLKRYTKD
jgi:hypothetical protein